MREVELRTTHLMRVWWLVFWRGTIGGMAMGFVAGVIVVGVAIFIGIGSRQFDMVRVHDYARIAGVIVGVIWNINVVRMALEKQYRGFRLALIDTSGREPPETF